MIDRLQNVEHTTQRRRNSDGNRRGGAFDDAEHEHDDDLIGIGIVVESTTYELVTSVARATLRTAAPSDERRRDRRSLRLLPVVLAVLRRSRYRRTTSRLLWAT